MVGYQKNETLTQNQKLLIGCMSGIVTRFITQPLEVLKLRAQLQKNVPPNPERKWFKLTRRILKEENTYKAFWKGHNVGQIQSVLAVSSQFYVYEIATKIVVNNGYGKNKNYTNCFCGLVAGCCSTTLVLPLEVIKLRQIVENMRYQGVLNGARKVYSSGGFTAFYEGWTASILQVGPASAMSFGLFGFFQPIILHYMHDCSHGKCKHPAGNAHSLQNLMFASTIAAITAGFLSKTITYPLDLAKKRMQLKSHKSVAKTKSQELVRCYGLISCLTDTVKMEGWIGIYRGFKVTMYKAVLTSVVSFSSYELFCYTVREFQAAVS